LSARFGFAYAFSTLPLVACQHAACGGFQEVVSERRRERRTRPSPMAILRARPGKAGTGKADKPAKQAC
jgi:hypothetical protein